MARFFESSNDDLPITCFIKNSHSPFQAGNSGPKGGADGQFKDFIFAVVVSFEFVNVAIQHFVGIERYFIEVGDKVGRNLAVIGRFTQAQFRSIVGDRLAKFGRCFSGAF